MEIRDIELVNNIFSFTEEDRSPREAEEMYLLRVAAGAPSDEAKVFMTCAPRSIMALRLSCASAYDSIDELFGSREPEERKMALEELSGKALEGYVFVGPAARSFVASLRAPGQLFSGSFVPKNRDELALWDQFFAKCCAVKQPRSKQ